MYGNNFGYPFMNSMGSGTMMGQMGPAMGMGQMGAPMGMGRAAAPMGGGMTGGLRSLLGLAPRGAAGAGMARSGFSFSNLLNGASKTLGVVNQAIPIVKQVGPMMNNMKSMLKIASVFKDETDTTSLKKEGNSSNVDNSTNNSSPKEETSTETINIQTNNSPNFFL